MSSPMSVQRLLYTVLPLSRLPSRTYTWMSAPRTTARWLPLSVSTKVPSDDGVRSVVSSSNSPVGVRR
jgi:hypothetical protein